MALRVSTTGSDVDLDDLGITITHPTTDRDLSLEFTSVELRDSEDLTTAIQGADLEVNDGTNFIHQDDYDPDELLLQELDVRVDSLYMSNNELSSVGDNYIEDGVFPLALNSTASITRNVYTVGGRWITWQLEPGDKIVIAGSSGADGTYTVESITDQQNFIVVEAINNSTGGTVEAFNPVGATRIGVDPTNLDWTSAEDLQTVLEELDISGTGITESEHRTLDQLVHQLDEDYYEEVVYTGIQPTNVTYWTNSGKTTKIREHQYTYGLGRKLTQQIIIQYNGSGVEVERLTLSYTYQGTRLDTVTCVRT